MKAIRVDSVVNQALEEHPPPYESQSNGLVESAVKSVRGMARTLHVASESSSGRNHSPMHAIVSLLVSHAANIQA